MSETRYCYHCGIFHLVEEMRQISTKASKRWRCIQSIEAAKADIAKRDAFGRRMSEINRAEAQARLRIAKPAEKRRSSPAP